MSVVLDRVYNQQSNLGKTGILLINQDPAVCLGLKTYLKEYVGFENVFIAHSVRDAIELLKHESSIQLLTIDCQTEHRKETEILEQIEKHTPRNLGVTLITDQSQQKSPVRSIGKLRVNHFPSKTPFEFEKLEPIILESLESLKSQYQTEFRDGFSVNDNFEETMLLNRVNQIEQRLSQNSESLSELKRRTAFRTFFSIIFQLLLIGALALFAWQTGLIERGWSKLRNHSGEPTAIQIKS